MSWLALANPSENMISNLFRINTLKEKVIVAFLILLNRTKGVVHVRQNPMQKLREDFVGRKNKKNNKIVKLSFRRCT
ncbi:hypothetical protein F8388_023766 [Cannabis sativa]|uniref:Uncharacterized protein n=1 Tax=Cannabis sativa TaxID=3483 RepID=A0A7J6GC96_CANSA|nr:hypothetical protein F8388_023766 [Cannabis sativa]